MPATLDFGPFAALSEAARRSLAEAAAPRTFRPGEVLLREGEPSDAAYAVLSGRLRVVSGDERRVLAILAAPALVGEIALLLGKPRTATVEATSAVRALRLPAEALRAALAADPAFASELRDFAAAREVSTFLRRSSPFADLPSPTLAELATKLHAVRFAAGEVLLREGEHGDDAYLLRSGEVVVTRGEGAGGRELARLGAGAFVGEVSALTGAPRSATVAARTAVEALRLSGDDVRPIVRRHRALVDRLESAMQSRHEPRKSGRATTLPAPDDPNAVVLHDESSGAYLRLSREALAIYEDLDGNRSLRDLALRHFTRTGALDPQGVFATVATLQAAGLASAPRVTSDAPDARLLRVADLVLAPRVELRNADPLASALHRAFWPLFTRAGAIAAIVVGTAGLVTFAGLFRLASPTDFGVAGIAVAFVGLLIAGAGHEAAHAIATKAEGRRIGRAGIGLLWFTPVIYVDTSDAWLIDRGRRVRINAAGPLFNYALAGAFALLALVTIERVQDLALWLAFVNLISVVFNLSPLLEFDGYYVLSDLANVNALRAKALRYVFRDLADHPRRPRTRAELGFVVYAVAALLYVIAISAVVLAGVPGLVQGLLPALVDPALRIGAGAIIALVLTALLVGPFVAEVLAARARKAAA